VIEEIVVIVARGSENLAIYIIYRSVTAAALRTRFAYDIRVSPSNQRASKMSICGKKTGAKAGISLDVRESF